MNLKKSFRVRICIFQHKEASPEKNILQRREASLMRVNKERQSDPPLAPKETI
jgi:hypothetical protein